MSNLCDAKRFYDTEFEAEISAAKMTYKLKSEIVHYSCGKHWHLAHRDPSQWGRYREVNPGYCDSCEQYMRPSRYKEHIKKERHKYLERKKQKEAV